MFRLALALFTLSACVTMSLKSSGTHIDTANEALERGDYDAAEKEYTLARQRAEGDGAAWVRAEADRGEAKIGIWKIRKEVPLLRQSPDKHMFLVTRVNDMRNKLRGHGGDAEVDAELVVVLNEHALRWVAEAEAQAARGEVYAAATMARPLLATLDLRADVRARVQKLQDSAASASRARATAAGDAHPLARQFHLAIAASYAGGSAPDPAPLLAPFQRGVEVAVTAPASCALAELPADLRQPGTTRRASVEVTITTCTASESTKESSETAKWTEDVLDGYDTVNVPEQQCRQECGSVLSGGESCETNYNTNPPSLLCTKNTITKCFEVCETVQVPKQVPRYRKEDRSEKRTVTTRTSTSSVVGSWVVRRDGKEWTGQINLSPSSSLTTAPSVGKAPSRSDGSFSSPSDLLVGARASAKSAIQSQLDKVFAADIESAVAAGRASAGKIDDEEEAWLRALLFGGADIGPLAARYDLDRERTLALFTRTTYRAAPPEVALDAPRVFATVERKGTNAITSNDRDELAKGTPPKEYWLQFDVSRLSFPADELGNEGDTGLLVGVRAATAVFGRLTKKTWGLRLADELSGGFALGGRTGGPEAMDDALASFAGTASVHYSAGLAYRLPARGGLFAGVRASYEVFLVGRFSGDYTAAPLFARVEIPFNRGTLGAEVLGFSLSGREQIGLSLHLSNKRKWADSRLKYLQLRIEQTNVESSIQDLDAPDGRRMVPGQDLTEVHLMYGIAL